MAVSTYHDPSYAAFVKLLHQKDDVLQTIDKAKLGGAVVHYLSRVPSAYITPFCNTIATSPAIWAKHPKQMERCDVLTSAVRSACRAKAESVIEVHKDPSKRKMRKELGAWVTAVLEGVVAQHPDPAIRLCMLTGLLQGLEDHKEYDIESQRGKVEKEVVIACAELAEIVIPEGTDDVSDWNHQYEEENHDRSPMALRHLTLVMKLAPAMLPLSLDNLVLLDLEVIARLTLDQIRYTFQGGHFLKSLPSSFSTNANGLLEIDKSSYIVKNLDLMTSYPGFQQLSTLSKLLSRCIAGMATQSLTRVAGWELMVSIIEQIEDIARPLEADWARSACATVTDEARIAPETKPILTSLWNVLKSLLFSSIMIAQSMLLVMSFEPHPSQLWLKPDTHTHALASAIVSMFLHFSFITSKFGGGLTSHGGGFTEQKKVFYGALDILAADPWETELCMKRIAGKLPGLSLELSHPVREARTSFFLACSEQLMPKLSETLVEHTVLPVAYHHLSRPAHRETYESAHSVFLSVFSNHTRLHSNEETSTPTNGKKKGKGKENDDEKGKLAAKLTPFYITCLLENAGEGKLSDDQLRLAYSSLTRSATSTSPALAQLCIDSLLSSISSSSSKPDISRLRLVLISLISAVDSTLLPSLLATVRSELLKEGDYEKRAKLKDAVFKQVLREVGDAEREIAMKWWLDAEHELEPGM
ncbi:hypothetical protein M407DRAFT_157454 [Tulasnella calospora MUT 4182]|uniref:Uncharacterized protein n=1 Tax=Tulasnella calospora MUT 4182 TaxID=1051891 RepID=A0A0C3Q610_9AGAM|nr:hypothetical protein M407DRAFT_157454 [Tulasnella calospora MUT 4182]